MHLLLYFTGAWSDPDRPRFASGKQAASDRHEEKEAAQLQYASGVFAGSLPDLQTFLNQVKEIMTSGDETIKMALRVNVIAFHQAVKNQEEITALKSKISNHGRDIDELKKGYKPKRSQYQSKEKIIITISHTFKKEKMPYQYEDFKLLYVHLRCMPTK